MPKHILHVLYIRHTFVFLIIVQFCSFKWLETDRIDWKLCSITKDPFIHWVWKYFSENSLISLQYVSLNASHKLTYKGILKKMNILVQYEWLVEVGCLPMARGELTIALYKLIEFYFKAIESSIATNIQSEQLLKCFQLSCHNVKIECVRTFMPKITAYA